MSQLTLPVRHQWWWHHWCIPAVLWQMLPSVRHPRHLALRQDTEQTYGWYVSQISFASGPLGDHQGRNLTYIEKGKIFHSISKEIIKSTVKCRYNACHYNANASLTRSILGSQTAPTSWHALMTVPEWLSTWAKGVKSSRSDRPQRQWHPFVPIQME